TKSEVKSLLEVIPEFDDSKSKTLFSPKGCEKCDKSGYQSRIGVREVLEVNNEIREMIMKRANAEEIKNAAVRNGMVTMIKDGIEKASQGLTTIEEVLRIIHE
ncbi:MAG: type II secretion system protein GspE, partial [bacterium]|nr:type II secretion system protein GspE [bacterium]